MFTILLIGKKREEAKTRFSRSRVASRIRVGHGCLVGVKQVNRVRNTRLISSTYVKCLVYIRWVYNVARARPPAITAPASNNEIPYLGFLEVDTLVPRISHDATPPLIYSKAKVKQKK